MAANRSFEFPGNHAAYSSKHFGAQTDRQTDRQADRNAFSKGAKSLSVPRVNSVYLCDAEILHVMKNFLQVLERKKLDVMNHQNSPSDWTAKNLSVHFFFGAGCLLRYETWLSHGEHAVDELLLKLSSQIQADWKTLKLSLSALWKTCPNGKSDTEKI